MQNIDETALTLFVLIPCICFTL